VTWSPLRCSASDIRAGDQLEVAGRELHDDLAGLVIVLSVAEVDASEKRVRIRDSYTDSWVHFRPDEEVRGKREGWVDPRTLPQQLALL